MPRVYLHIRSHAQKSTKNSEHRDEAMETEAALKRFEVLFCFVLFLGGGGGERQGETEKEEEEGCSLVGWRLSRYQRFGGRVSW